MSAAELRQAAETLFRADELTLTASSLDALADAFEEMAEGYDLLAEMYVDAEDAALRAMRGFESAVELARIINGGAS